MRQPLARTKAWSIQGARLGAHKRKQGALSAYIEKKTSKLKEDKGDAAMQVHNLCGQRESV